MAHISVDDFIEKPSLAPAYIAPDLEPEWPQPEPEPIKTKEKK